MPEGSAIAEMFGGIAPRYDLANHVLSFGLDFGWRRRLVQAVAEGLSEADSPRNATVAANLAVTNQGKKRPVVVDLATGSGDVAFALKKHLGAEVEVCGLDFCAPMLEIAERKKAARPWARDIIFAPGDCLNLPLANDSVDALTIAFGARNLADRARGFGEMRRVLKPGGRLLVLEFSQPASWLRTFYYFYLRAVMPRLGGLITGQPAAYRYLTGSIAQFPGRAALAAEITAAGFSQVRHEGLGLGAIALHVGEK